MNQTTRHFSFSIPVLSEYFEQANTPVKEGNQKEEILNENHSQAINSGKTLGNTKKSRNLIHKPHLQAEIVSNLFCFFYSSRYNNLPDFCSMYSDTVSLFLYFYLLRQNRMRILEFLFVQHM